MAKTLHHITAAVDVDTHGLLAKAAALSSASSINSFVLSAAIEKAKQVIEHEKTLTLSQADAMLMMEALDKPATASMKLKLASERYGFQAFQDAENKLFITIADIGTSLE